VKILVTNDDGISSTGLHVLARTMRRHGDVVIVAPDTEYSGAGAAIGALHLLQPVAKRVTLAGIEESWTINGPPALCVMFARFGLFGHIDLVVSGINPGANVGRAVYHSGTVGAAITARNGGISAVAVSQAVDGLGVEGQAWEDMIRDQHWQSAADVASAIVGGLAAAPPMEPVVVNLNVPNLALDDIRAWRHTSVGTAPLRAVGSASLEPISGTEDSYSVRMGWGEIVDSPVDTDTGAVERDEVSITYLSRLDHEARGDLGHLDRAVDGLLGG
jgi:5'-nucleotidase